MPKLRPPLVAAIGALLLVGALFLSFFLSTAAYRTDDEVLLPSETTKTPQTDTVLGKNLKILGDVQVTVDNVQQVIASLGRAQSYTMQVTSRLYYGETSGTTTYRQTVRQGACRTDVLSASGATLYSELLWDGMCYAWRSGSSSYTTSRQGAFVADRSASLPTYETVCELPREAITGGALVQTEQDMLLTVDTQEQDRIGVYKISAQTGLLQSASFSEDGKMVRSVECTVDTAEPEDSLFILPGMTQAVFAQADENNE